MTSKVFLVGMMGAGKSSVGPLLADKLGWRYLDSDAEVQRATGQTIPEIFASEGEASFREEEARVLGEAVSASAPAVVSVAGGAVLEEANRTLLREGGVVVWLRASIETLAERVGDGDGRPLLGGDPRAALERLYKVREPLYEEVADLVVDVDSENPDAIVDRIHRAVGPSCSGGGRR